jgi:hypothetical protein
MTNPILSGALNALGFMIAALFLAWYFIRTRSLLLLSMAVLVWLVTGCQQVTNNEEETMSRVIFYNDFNFTVPASPGSAFSTLSLSPEANYFGMIQPNLASPVNGLPVLGCSKESNIKILNYRYSFIGPRGLRPAVDNSISGLFVGFLRATQWSPEYAQDIFLPFVDSEEWIPSGQFLKVIPTEVPLMTPQFSLSRVDVDTRNLQDIYYGTAAIMRLEIECECELVL